jgi:diketogulonate reductase-like aldo/keto reductase/polysaccharide pyruvyl transferase WcaK-like protein
METVTLNNGVAMPMVGLGTYPMNGPRLAVAVAKALAAGYERFDSASAYGNEAWLGRALALCRPLAGGRRLFLATKLGNADQRGDVRAALQSSLRRLRVPQVDLYLLHWPQPDTYLDAWRQMERLYHEGLARAIGVCNFHPHHLDRLLEMATVVPAVNQVELHPLLSQVPLREYCRVKGIVVEAYSPVARMHARLVRNPDLVRLALDHGKTVPQVVLRWHVQQDIPVVPKSSRWAGLKDNLSVFDFSLAPGEMDLIDGLNEEFRIRFNPDTYPFRKPKPPAGDPPPRTAGRRHVLLYGHGGSSNRGCEAIVRSTSALLKKTLGPDLFIQLSSHAPREDREAAMPAVDAVVDSGTAWPATSPVRWARAALWRLCPTDAAHHLLSNLRTIQRAGHAEICLSVGGDNYCYDPVEIHYALNRILRRRCRRLVLWGCSIDPERMNAAMVADLRGFDLVTARESITFSALRERGVERAKLYPDPAFAMEEERLPLPPGWREGQMVGLNVSALVERYEQVSGGALSACVELVRHILAHTECGVVLAPHVTGRPSDDRYPLGDLYRAFRGDGRVIMLPGGLHAPQLKGYISRCRFFVGARTHATIAAYSTGVPTLVLGYSVKARGIARDLFGDETGLVLPVQDLEDARQLTGLFEGLREREGDLRAQLAARMPAILLGAEAAAGEIGRLLGDGARRDFDG